MPRIIQSVYGNDKYPPKDDFSVGHGEAIDLKVSNLPTGFDAYIAVSKTVDGDPLAVFLEGRSTLPEYLIEGHQYFYNVWAGKGEDYVVIRRGSFTVENSITGTTVIEAFLRFQGELVTYRGQPIVI